MITNERQYKITKSQAEKFKTAIDVYSIEDAVAEGTHPAFAKAQFDQLNSEYDILLEQVNEYELLISGEENEFEASSLQELPLVLIKARIARNWTQKELADSLGMKEQQIQRYESDLYRKANLKTLSNIADTLGLDFFEKAYFQEDKSSLNAFSKTLPIGEIFKRGWFEDFSGTLFEAKKKSSALVERLFIHAGVTENQLALHRKKLRTGSTLNESALLAWQARILMLCGKQKIYQEFNSDRMTNEWFSELAKLSQFKEGPLLARDWLLENGIYFAYEPHLPKTYLDGAAIKHPDGTPIVAVTLRHDRLDNFWFVLFHELAHIKLHFPLGDYSDFFDDTDIESNDIENEADQFALDALIQPEKWETCLSRFSLNSEMIRDEAKQLQISPAIIAGRIRNEQNNFYILNDTVGHKEVRKCFDLGLCNYELF